MNSNYELSIISCLIKISYFLPSVRIVVLFPLRFFTPPMFQAFSKKEKSSNAVLCTLRLSPQITVKLTPLIDTRYTLLNKHMRAFIHDASFRIGKTDLGSLLGSHALESAIFETSNPFPDACRDLGACSAPGEMEWHWGVWLSAFQWRTNSAGVVNVRGSLEIGVRGRPRRIKNCLQLHTAHLHFVFWRALLPIPRRISACSCTFFERWLNLYSIRVWGTYRTEQIELALKVVTRGREHKQP